MFDFLGISWLDNCRGIACMGLIFFLLGFVLKIKWSRGYNDFLLDWVEVSFGACRRAEFYYCWGFGQGFFYFIFF
jgi:hypothetical protein